MEKLTAIVQLVQFLKVVLAEIHSLAYDIQELWYVGDDGGLCSIPECSLAVVHHRIVVIGNIQEVWSFIIIFIEIMFFT